MERKDRPEYVEALKNFKEWSGETLQKHKEKRYFVFIRNLINFELDANNLEVNKKYIEKLVTYFEDPSVSEADKKKK